MTSVDVRRWPPAGLARAIHRQTNTSLKAIRLKMRQGRLLDMPATDRSPSGRRCRAIKPPGLVEDAEHLFQLSLRCTLVLRRWNPAFRPWRVHWSLARLATYSAVAADNANDASKTVSACPEESPTVRCRGFSSKKYQALAHRVTWPSLAEIRWKPRHHWCRTPRHYSASLGSDAARTTRRPMGQGAWTAHSVAGGAVHSGQNSAARPERVSEQGGSLIVTSGIATR